MTVGNYPRSISDILSDVVNQFSTLVRKEVQLARAEMSEKITDLTLGLGLLVGVQFCWCLRWLFCCKRPLRH